MAAAGAETESEEIENSTAPQHSAVRIVVLDPGHGGQDSGAMCGGVLEKDLTLDVARRIDRLLEADGIATQMTRLGDTYVSLADRAAFANRVSNCIFVSIHFKRQAPFQWVENLLCRPSDYWRLVLASWLPFLWRALSESPHSKVKTFRFYLEALVARTRASDRGQNPNNFL